MLQKENLDLEQDMPSSVITWKSWNSQEICFTIWQTNQKDLHLRLEGTYTTNHFQNLRPFSLFSAWNHLDYVLTYYFSICQIFDKFYSSILKMIINTWLTYKWGLVPGDIGIGSSHACCQRLPCHLRVPTFSDQCREKNPAYVASIPLKRHLNRPCVLRTEESEKLPDLLSTKS